MDTNHLATLCRQVASFAFRQNWQLKATPTITWEFDTISDFAAAQFAISNTVRELCPYITRDEEVARYLEPGVTEITCLGVTFRMSCRQVIDTPLGPRHANELKFEHFDPSKIAP